MSVQTPKSNLDEIINYKERVKDLIMQSKEVLGLITNNPNIDITSAEALSVLDNNIYDFPYIDDTVQETSALIMVDADVTGSNSSIKDIALYVQVVLDKKYMNLKGNGFTGLKGNRLDNICRFIDLLIRDNMNFGIGKPDDFSAIASPVPKQFTSRMLAYSTNDFAKRGKFMNG